MSWNRRAMSWILLLPTPPRVRVRSRVVRFMVIVRIRARVRLQATRDADLRWCEVAAMLPLQLGVESSEIALNLRLCSVV